MSQEEEVRDILIKRFVSSPFANQYVAKLRATQDTRIHTPADVIGERYLRLLTLLTKDTAQMKWVNRAPGFSDLGERCAIAIRASLAAPYLWLWDCVEAARNLELPEHVISPSILPQPRMWWTYQDSIGLTDSRTGDDIGVMDAQVISDEREGFTVAELGANDVGPQETEDLHVMAHTIEYGKRWPDDFDGAPGVGQILKALAFLNSRFIPKHIAKPTRGERRRAERAGEDVPDITFVSLRRAPALNRGDGDGFMPVDWKHRWIVSGHYRAQWYPSEQAHHVIYIEPYLKGPEDAPLLEHTYRVER